MRIYVHDDAGNWSGPISEAEALQRRAPITEERWQHYERLEAEAQIRDEEIA
jgi:hypothetical protein